MTVVDPGHVYLLDALDGDAVQRLQFVKREGEKFPGNKSHHSGTTIQEVLRALIERTRYINNQVPCAETESVTNLLVTALLLLETRAARRHGRELDVPLEVLIAGTDKCQHCGHIGCTEPEHKVLK